MSTKSESPSPPPQITPGQSDNHSGTTARPETAKTNYGSQVSYNYGTISNYFCYDYNPSHQCDFPTFPSSKSVLERQLYMKIERARTLYKSGRWYKAKLLFDEVLHIHQPAVTGRERILIQYNLAHAHFMLAEFSDAAKQFQDLIEIHDKRNGAPDKSVSDSRFWLARSFYHLEKYEDASTELQIFILKHNQGDTRGVEQTTAGQLWLGLTFERQGLYKNAKEQLEISFDTRVQILGSENLETLAGRHHLANFLYKRKQFLEAHEHFQALLHSEERLKGPEQHQAVRTRCMLGLCLAKLERYDDAKPHLQRVLTHLESIRCERRDEVRDKGLVRYWLGRIAMSKDQEHSPLAESHNFRQALNHLSQATDADSGHHRDGNNPHNNQSSTNNQKNSELQDEIMDCRRYLARAMLYEGQWAGAEQAFRELMNTLDSSKQDELIANRYGLASSLISQRKFREAKSIIQEVVGSTTPLENCRHTGEDLGACLQSLGGANIGLERYDEARDCFQRIVDVVPEKPNWPHTRSKLELGRTFFELREFENSRRHLQEAYDTLTQHLPPSRLQLQARFWLSWALCELDRFEEAAAHLEATFTLFQTRKITAQSDFVLGRSHYYMGRVVSHQKDYGEATKRFRTAQPMLGRYFSPEHPVHLECRYHLAHALFRLEESSEARLIFEELLNSQCEHIAIQDIRITLAPYWLGRISSRRGHDQAAAQYYEKCLDALGERDLPGHPNCPNHLIWYDYALCLYYTDKTEESAKIMRRLLDQLPADHPRFAQYSYLLGQCLHRTQKYEEACERLKVSATVFASKYGNDDIIGLGSRALLVDSLCELQRYDEADPLLASLTMQQNASPGTEKAKFKGIGSYWLGHRKFQHGKLKAAEDCFTTVQRLVPRRKNWDRIHFYCQHHVARIQHENKQYAEAGDMFRELANQQYRLGEISHAVDNQYWLSFSLLKQRKYAASRPVAQKVLDDNHPGRIVEHVIPRCHFPVGYSLFQIDKIKEAKAEFEIAVDYPHEFCLKFRSVFYLGKSNHLLGLLEDAKAIFQSLVENGHSDPETNFKCRYWLGRCHFELKNWHDAMVHLQKAYTASQKKWNDALASQYFLGRTHFAAANYEAAEPLFRSLYNTQKDKNSIKIPDFDYYFGATLLELHRYQESKTILSKTMSRQQKKHSQNTLLVMTTRYQLSRCLGKLDEWAQSQSELESIAPFFASRSTEGDETIVHIQYDLACMAFKHKNWSQALHYFQNTLTSHEMVRAHSSLDILQCKYHLAATLRELEKYDEALEICEHVLEKRMEILQPPHQLLIDAQSALCQTLRCLEKFTEALPFNCEALDWQEQLSGTQDPRCTPLRFSIAVLASKTLNFELAQDFFSRAFAQFESSEEVRKLVTDPVAALYGEFAMTLSKLGRADEAKQQAVKALQCNGSEGRKHCQALHDFEDTFGELLRSVANSNSSLNGQPPSLADDRPTNLVDAHLCDDSQLKNASKVEQRLSQINTPVKPAEIDSTSQPPVPGLNCPETIYINNDSN